ncbi:MAG: hypothetical protein F6K42_21190 [Leptolyngbya sp. SIO1D8]|nr:hypothetical protein [Leptolyngbya sp. SIO1D8]
MSHRINVTQAETLFENIYKASGLTRDAFNRIRREIEARVDKSVKALKKAESSKKASERADEIPFELTLDRHLFNRCFSGKVKRVSINDAFYEYQPKYGYWKVLDDRLVLKQLQAASDKAYRWVGKKENACKKYCGSHAAAKNALAYARVKLSHTDKLVNQHLRAFKNCTVDMRTGESRQHQPSHYLTSVIASDYKPSSHCPDAFDRFMSVSYGDDMKPIIRAAISMLLDPTAPYSHFIHVIGPSGSGKGVFLRLLQELFGTENSRGGSSFLDFADAEKRHQNLLGCSLFVIGDIAGYQKGLEAFYDLVDNASMSGRALFNPSGYSQKWNVRFAIASVEYLQLENTGGGWDRRVIPILSKRRDESEDIPDLEAALSEVKGEIISWALAMPKDERDAVIKEPHLYSDRVAAAAHESAIYGDSIKSFVDACLEPIDAGSTVVEVEVNQACCMSITPLTADPVGLGRKGLTSLNRISKRCFQSIIKSGGKCVLTKQRSATAMDDLPSCLPSGNGFGCFLAFLNRFSIQSPTNPRVFDV